VTEVRLDHVSVTTADLARSIEFYRDVLGLPLLDSGELEGEELETLVGRPGARARWAELALGGSQVLEVLEYESPHEGALEPAPWRAGATHVGLAVDALDRVLARLRDADAQVSDVVTLSEPGWEGVRCVYAADPDGVSIELVERPRERVVVLPEARADALTE
jgi:catechol 2,3-dioxygenase-like lactoylglutathione lyase family enzyme